MQPEMQQTARGYLEKGLSVLPANVQLKFPALSHWKTYQDRLPTRTEVHAWFSNPHSGLCVVTGAVSGNLEMIDFDFEAELFDDWQSKILEAAPDLLPRLVVETTQSGGRHVIYRCREPISGNLKLAQRKIPTSNGDEIIIAKKPCKPRQDKDGTWSVTITLIETRGQGGLFLCDPTPGYSLEQGNLTDIPTITAEQRELLLEAAWSLNEVIPEPEPIPTYTGSSSPSGSRPGDEFNARGDMRAILQAHGWVRVKEGEREYWRRPGKQIGWSATLKDGSFYVWSTNAEPFREKTTYSPFAVYAHLEHHGDFSRAASELAKQGYGQKLDTMPEEVISNLTGKNIDEDPWDDGSKSLTELIASFQGLNKPIIHGLLREGETMNIIASSKIGKSWLVNSLTISIAAGMDWLGLKVDQGCVLLIDNELHQNTTTYRFMEVTKALNLPSHLFSDQLRVRSLRGDLKDMNQLGEIFSRIKPGRYRVIVIDAFYRTLPDGTDENDNGAIAALYNKLDRYALQLKCAFILIHHTSKGNQAAKSVTDVGAGAGAQSRAADTHVVLRPHEEKDKIVMDAATRSWPPLDTLVLAKQHPLFVIDDDADPTALLGAAKTGQSKSAMGLEEFVESCIASQDPCIYSEIVRVASEQHGRSKRQVRQLIDEAIEEQLIMRLNAASSIRYVKIREGFSGEKGQWVAALLARNPNAEAAQVASVVGVSERYVRRLKSGTGAELE